MKLWQTTTEWAGYAPCGDKIDFILPPETLGRTRTKAVKETCAGCPVRPECISEAVDHKSDSVWIAGRWVGDHHSAANRRAAKALRSELAETVPTELANRPEEIL